MTVIEQRILDSISLREKLNLIEIFCETTNVAIAAIYHKLKNVGKINTKWTF